MKYLGLVVIPLCTLIGTCLVHAVLTRLLRYAAIASQAAALGSIVLGNIVILSLAVSFAWLSENLLGLIYILLLYNSLALCYFLVSNTSETSLHVHILMEVLLAEGLSSDELAKRYNSEHMIDARIDRMITAGQLVERGGAYIVTGRAVLIVGKIYDLWRRVLSMPRCPE
jgi:hypothetical protein